MEYTNREISPAEQLANEKATCEAVIEDQDAMLRLLENKDFLKIIDKGFMEVNVIRQADMAADPNVSEEIQRNCASAILASGHLKRYLNAINNMGNTARAALERVNQEIDELLELPEGEAEGEE